MKTVIPESYLTLHYRIILSDGSEAVSTYDLGPATLQLGAGQLSPSLETCLLGLEEGGEASFDLSPERAFGERNPRLIERIALSALPAELKPEELKENSLVEFTAPNGAGFSGLLREKTATHGVFDFNHPLAGQSIRFEVKIIGIL